MDLLKSYTKEYLKEILSEGLYTVSFFKKNGERRDMNCTLLNKYLPKVEPILNEDGTPKEKKVKAESPDTLSVFDIEKSEWRSFVVESVFDIMKVEDSDISKQIPFPFMLDTDPMIQI